MPTTDRQAQTERLDLHLYAERLARHAERVAEELADARLLDAWSAIDEKVRTSLTDLDQRTLQTVGLLTTDDRRTNIAVSIAHNEVRLTAIHRAQKIVAELIAAESRPKAQEPEDALEDALATYPNCYRCGGKGCTDSQARHLTRCEECEGTGRAPAPAEEPDYVSVVLIVDTSTREGEKFVENVIESIDPVVHSSCFSGTYDALRWLDDKGKAHHTQAVHDLADYEQEG